jgi:dolichol-phosphate mannosyltransferase
MAGAAFLLIAGSVWISKGPTAEQAAGDPGLIADYFKGFWSGWTPQYLLGRSEIILNVGFLAVQAFGALKFLLGAFMEPLAVLKITGLVFFGLSGISMYFFVRSLTSNPKAAAVAGFLYVTMPAIIVRSVFYEHIGVSMAFIFIPLLLRGLWVLTQVRSPREMVLLGLAAAGLSLSYTKMAVTILPMLLIWIFFCLGRAKVSKLVILRSYLGAAGIAALAGLSILLPAFSESRNAALFALDPLDGWQKHYSFKTPLSWVDLSKFFLAAAGPDFEGDSQYFFIGAVPLIGVSLGLGLERLSDWRRSEEGRWFLALLTCWLLSLWMASGPWGILGGHLYLLSSAQNLADHALPLIWFVFFWILWMVWKTLREITHQGRVIPALGSLVFVSLPIFPLLAKIPFFGDVRGPESFWSTAGYACLVAATALVGVPLLTQPASAGRRWRPVLFSVVLVAYLVHFLPVYQAFGRGGLDANQVADYERAAEFLKTAPRAGRVHPMSSRYYYLTIPEKTGRGLSTEALLRHFQLKWVRHFEVASQASMDLFQKYLNLAGVAYLLVDKSDPSIPPQVVEGYRQAFPTVFESNNLTILENRGSMFPAFFAKDFVAYPGSSYLQSPAILQLSGLNFLAVEATPPDPNTPGLAGIAKGEGDVELTPAYRDRTGTPFMPVSTQAPRNSDYGRVGFNLSHGHGGGWLAVTEAWHPDWRVQVNGTSRPATRVAGALLGTRVEPGETSVEFRFHQPAWYLGGLVVGISAWISLLGLLVLTPRRWVPSAFQAWWQGGYLDLEKEPSKASLSDISKRTDGKSAAAGKIQKFLVILPTYNEGETIQHVLEKVQTKAPGAEILVVDDNSPDCTAAKVKQTPNFGKKVHLLERPGKAGLGSAYKEGFQWAMKRGYDAVVVLDVGLSYDPADIPKLIQALTEGADIAVGSRYLNGVRVLNWPQSRLWMSLCAAMGVRMLVGLPMTDPASRFHAIRRRVFEGLHWDQSLGPESDSPIEIYLRAWQAGFRVHEVPIVFAGREEGQSKISLLMARGTAWRVLQLAVRRVFP